jgi:predicted nucleic acid-binding protein
VHRVKERLLASSVVLSVRLTEARLAALSTLDRASGYVDGPIAATAPVAGIAVVKYNPRDVARTDATAWDASHG